MWDWQFSMSPCHLSCAALWCLRTWYYPLSTEDVVVIYFPLTLSTILLLTCRYGWWSSRPLLWSDRCSLWKWLCKKSSPFFLSATPALIISRSIHPSIQRSLHLMMLRVNQGQLIKSRIPSTGHHQIVHDMIASRSDFSSSTVLINASANYEWHVCGSNCTLIARDPSKDRWMEN